MQFSSTTIIALAVAQLAAASPVKSADYVPVLVEPEFSSASAGLDKRQSVTATVEMFSGDICNGFLDSFSVQGSGASRCVPVTNKRSIRHIGEGCTVKSWSGIDCGGSEADIGTEGCQSILYGSVSVSC